LKVIAEKAGGLWKANSDRKRTVIFTQGSKNTVVYHDGQIKEFTPILVPREEIVDTNGAGDSFVGGFLARYIQGASIEECVKAGFYVASVIIRTAGTTFKGKPSFSYP